MSNIKSAGVFQLFDLPAELRIKIYEYGITVEDKPRMLPFNTIGMHHRKIRSAADSWDVATTLQTWVQPSLTRTCSEIRKHTLPLFYSMNAFEIDYCGQLDRTLKSPCTMFAAWLAGMGAQNRSLLRNVFVCDGPHTVFTMGDQLWKACFDELERKLHESDVVFTMDNVDVYGRHRVRFLGHIEEQT